MVSRNHVLISVHKLVCVFLCYKVYSLLSPCFSCVMLKCAIVSSSQYALLKSVFLKLPHVRSPFILVRFAPTAEPSAARDRTLQAQPAQSGCCHHIVLWDDNAWMFPGLKGLLKRNDDKKIQAQYLSFDPSKAKCVSFIVVDASPRSSE